MKFSIQNLILRLRFGKNKADSSHFLRSKLFSQIKFGKMKFPEIPEQQDIINFISFQATTIKIIHDDMNNVLREIVLPTEIKVLKYFLLTISNPAVCLYDPSSRYHEARNLSDQSHWHCMHLNVACKERTVQEKYGSRRINIPFESWNLVKKISQAREPFVRVDRV